MKRLGFCVNREKNRIKETKCTRQLCTLYLTYDFYYFSNNNKKSFLLKIIKICYKISGVCYVPLKDIGDFLCLFHFLKHVVKLALCFIVVGSI